MPELQWRGGERDHNPLYQPFPLGFPDTGHWAELIEVNHDDKVVAAERFEITQQIKRLTLDSMVPKSKEVERRLTSPILSTSLDTRNIAFERWGEQEPLLRLLVFLCTNTLDWRE